MANKQDQKQQLQWKVANTTTWQIFKVGTPTVVLAAVAVVVLLITTVAGAGYFVSSQSNVVVNEAAVQQPISVEAPAAPETGPVAQEQLVVDERQAAVQEAMQLPVVRMDLDISQLREATSFQILQDRQQQLEEAVAKNGNAANLVETQPIQSPEAIKQAFVKGVIYMRTDTSSLGMTLQTPEGQMGIVQLVATLPTDPVPQTGGPGSLIAPRYHMLWGVTGTGDVVYLGELEIGNIYDKGMNQFPPMKVKPNQAYYMEQSTKALPKGLMVGDKSVGVLSFVATVVGEGKVLYIAASNYEVSYPHGIQKITFSAP
jgi:hypothetical protein